MTVGGSGKDVIPNSKAFSLEETSAERLVDGICDGGQDPLMSSSSASAASPLASMTMSKVMAPCRCTQPPATAMAITTSDHMRRISWSLELEMAPECAFQNEAMLSVPDYWEAVRFP